MLHEQHAGQYYNKRMCNKSFEIVEQFKGMGTTLKIKIPFMKNFRADWTQTMLAIINCRIFCLPVCYPKIKIYRTINLPVVSFGCETWSLTFRKEEWLRMFNSTMLRKLGPETDVVKGEWRSLHNVQLCELYPSLYIWVIKSIMRWAGHVTDTYWGVGNRPL